MTIKAILPWRGGCRTAAVSAALLALSLGEAPAATPPAGDVGSSPFSQFDHDQDGVVSYTEAMADPSLIDEFNQLDSDSNGQLDRGEFAQFEAQGLTNSPDILPPEPSEKAEKAPRLPSRDRDLRPPPPEPPPLGAPATDDLPRNSR